jgi:hypothetical protein
MTALFFVIVATMIAPLVIAHLVVKTLVNWVSARG